GVWPGEEGRRHAPAKPRTRPGAGAGAGLGAGQRKTEVETLGKVRTPKGDIDLPPVLDAIKVEAGYEMALAAALGEDLDAPLAPAAPVHWRLNAGGGADAALPAGGEPVLAPVARPPALLRRPRPIRAIEPAGGAPPRPA